LGSRGGYRYLGLTTMLLLMSHHHLLLHLEGIQV
jgi:hypothetical protein